MTDVTCQNVKYFHGKRTLCSAEYLDENNAKDNINTRLYFCSIYSILIQ